MYHLMYFVIMYYINEFTWHVYYCQLVNIKLCPLTRFPFHACYFYSFIWKQKTLYFLRVTGNARSSKLCEILFTILNKSFVLDIILVALLGIREFYTAMAIMQQYIRTYLHYAYSQSFVTWTICKVTNI